MLYLRAALVIVVVAVTVGAVCSNDLQRVYNARLLELRTETAKLHCLTIAKETVRNMKSGQRKNLNRMIKAQTGVVEMLDKEVRAALTELVAVRRAKQAASQDTRPLPQSRDDVHVSVPVKLEERRIKVDENTLIDLADEALMQGACVDKELLIAAAEDDVGHRNEESDPVQRLSGTVEPQQGTEFDRDDVIGEPVLHTKDVKYVQNYFDIDAPMGAHSDLQSNDAIVTDDDATSIAGIDDDLDSVSIESPIDHSIGTMAPLFLMPIRRVLTCSS